MDNILDHTETEYHFNLKKFYKIYGSIWLVLSFIVGVLSLIKRHSGADNEYSPSYIVGSLIGVNLPSAIIGILISLPFSFIPWKNQSYKIKFWRLTLILALVLQVLFLISIAIRPTAA